MAGWTGRTAENQVKRFMEEKTIEQGFRELDEVIEALQNKDLALEESFVLYKRGMELLKECNEKIDRVEKRVMAMNEEGEWDEF
ncbi:MAG: exodeoxyribonuclease VII small subunit [Lachnospiraceae bacterium]|nr:exodeoxyribonuclease VII small subunit [Robinsoniella sp.]MDY3766487.1 exodeoxyribonuclease VII small subunit [Lachnospiraceae bacterium]